MVTFYAPEEILSLVPDKTKVNLQEIGLNERQIKTLKLMVNEKGKMTNKQYCGNFNVSRQTTTRDLQELMEKNQIAEKGKGRASYYIAK